MSRIEAGKMTISSESFDVHNAIKSSVELVRLQAELKGKRAGYLQLVSTDSFDCAGLTLDLKIQDFVPRFVKCDPLRFRQVLLNLLSNAVKFTFHGRIDVYCMVEPVAAPADGSKRKEGLASLSVTVKDTGVGMHQEGYVRLFRMFSKVGGY